jgi:hypothetical protein
MPGSRQDALQAPDHHRRAVGDNDHTGVDRKADPDAAAVMTETQEAPLTALRSALSTGHSAIGVRAVPHGFRHPGWVKRPSRSRDGRGR